MQQKPRRPTGVTILGVLAILGGIALLFSGIVLIGLGLVIGTYVGSAITNALSNAGYSGLASIGVGTLAAILLALGAIFLILGILYFAVGVGYFGGKGWAWTIGIIVTFISIIFDVVQIALGAVSNAFGVIIGLLILYYLTRPHVKAFFGKGASTMGSSSMPPSGMSSMPMGSMGSSPTMGSMGMTCKNCGASIPAGATRCPSCGASV
jgi:hypothetical protein